MGEIFGAFAQTSWVAKGVLAILATFSLVSWSLTFLKIRQLRRAGRANALFLAEFRKATRLGEVQSAAGRRPDAPLAGMFKAGYLELEAQIRVLQRVGQDAGQIKSLAAVERALQRAIGIEGARLQKFLPFLATMASATPFIGLFGTVWGIMNSFQNIGLQQNTSLATVAPGIAEALIATAVGLFAAIPAVIFYNFFLHRLKGLMAIVEEFMLDFQNFCSQLQK
jgi:biopolymer transport protein TolQ